MVYCVWGISISHVIFPFYRCLSIFKTLAYMYFFSAYRSIAVGPCSSHIIRYLQTGQIGFTFLPHLNILRDPMKAGSIFSCIYVHYPTYHLHKTCNLKAYGAWYLYCKNILIRKTYPCLILGYSDSWWILLRCILVLVLYLIHIKDV